MSAAIFELPSTQAFMRAGYAGRWEAAARMAGMTVAAAQRQHLALRMAAVVLKTSDGVTAAEPVVLRVNGPKTRVDTACETAGITLEYVRSPSRVGDLVRRRQHVMWLLHTGGMSSPEIGRRLDRDHTTVLHGIKKHEERLKEQ
jgi:chromosomal replication initiation ATPase DnaA